MMAALLLGLATDGWITISQSLYGSSLEGIRTDQHQSSSPYQNEYYKSLGFLWTLPEMTSDKRGLG